MVWEFRARTIIEEPGVTERLAVLNERFPRFNDSYRALTWVLAQRCDRLPTKWRTLGSIKYNLYVQDSHPIAKTPWISVLFIYDDKTVKIIQVDAGK